jgi:hypothetical protein
MTDEERAQWAEINAILNPKPAGPQQPDAPGCAALSDTARETARTLYGESLLKKKELTPAEREFLRASIAATLKGIG